MKIEKELVLVEEDIVIRSLMDSDSDYDSLTKWYQDEEVYPSFEQRKLTKEEVIKKYQPRTLKDNKIITFIIEYQKNSIGLIQYQLVEGERKRKLQITENICYEIDMFIGDVNFRNQGIGTKCIKMLSYYLFQKKNAEKLILCPEINNVHAICCYEKCGFVQKRELEEKDTSGKVQKYILMERNKQDQ